MSVTLANITFSGFTGAGFAPTPGAGQLSSNAWSVAVSAANSIAFGGSASSGFLARGATAAPVTTGGFYALDRGAGDTALLIQPSGSDFTTSANNFVYLRLQHTGATPLASLTFDYDGLYRNDNARDTFVNFAYAVSSSSSLPASFTSLSALSFNTPTTAIGTALTTLDLPATNVSATVNANDFVFLRWNIGDISGSGSRDEVGFDNVVVSGTGVAPPAPTVSIAPATLSLSEGNSGTTAFAFTVSRSATTPGDATIPVTLTGGAGLTAADIASVTINGVAVPGFAIGTPFNLVLSGSATSAALAINVQGDTVIEADETFTLSLGAPSAGYALGAVSVATGSILNDDTAVVVTPISTIQGTGAASALVGQTVTIEGVVTGDFQNGDADATRNLQGFYVQTNGAGDGNALSSEGLFVFQGPTLGLDVNVGDLVRVTGTVAEFSGETQLSTAPATGISIVQAAAFTRQQVWDNFALEVNLPASSTVTVAGRVLPNLEFAEGMLIRLPQALTITEAFNVDRFGEFRVAQGPQAVQFTQTNLPDVAGFAAYLQELGARSLLVDDGLNVQNPNPITFLGTAVTTANAPQIGDTISSGLIGNLGFAFNEYRLQPANSPAVIDTAPREAAPGRDGGELKLASANLLNFFTTLNVPGALTGPPGNQQAPRGANTAEELARQKQKLYTALEQLDADVLVLNEVENNGFGASSAIQTLVTEFNAEIGAPGRWSFVDPGTPFLGGDAISVGILYRTDKVRLAAGSNVAVLDDSDIPALTTAGLLPANFLSLSTKGAVFNGPDTSRAVLVASLEEIGSGEVFTLSAVHNKSKAGIGTFADANAGDGAGNWNNQRLLANQALDAFLKTNPTGIADPDRVLMGDFNSYAKEVSIRHLTEVAGFTNLIEQRLGPDAASFVFDGQKGYLDYAFVTGSLLPAVRGVHEWRVNSPEFDAIDYNLDFGRPASIFDGTVPWRYSDHDPVVVNLLFDPGLMVVRGGVDIVGSRSFADATALALAGDTLAVRDAARITDGAAAVLGTDDLTVALGATDGFVFAFGANPAIDNARFTGTGTFTFNGDGRAETVQGNAGANRLNGGAGNDSLFGGEGDDTLDGGPGDDLLDGGLGQDLASYAGAAAAVRVNLGLAGPQATLGAGTDTLVSIENLTGSAFGDTLIGSSGGNVIRGGEGNDRIAGMGGADTLDGGTGNDDIRGGAGSQELRGGAGNDLLFGGADADRFVFGRHDGSDRIADFLRAEGDRIVLEGGTVADLLLAGSGFTFGATSVQVVNVPALLLSDFLFA